MATTTIRLHSYTTAEGFEAATGEQNADFRGENFVGKAKGDGHKTLIEYTVDENSPMIAEALEYAPDANKLFRRLYEAQVKEADRDTVPCLRLGIWSDKAEDGS